MARVSKEVRLLVVHLSMSGMSQRDIQKLVGCSLKTVNLIVQRFRDDGTVADRPRGRRRVTSEEEDRLIVAAVVDEPFLTADEIRRELGLTASEHTIRLRLHEAGLACFSGQMRRSLTAQHKEIRREFATEHADWDVGQWLSVVFTNESTMSLKWDPNRGAWKAVHSWVQSVLKALGRKSDESSLPPNVITYIPRNDPLSIRQLAVSGHVSINLFATMTYEGLGPLVRITGSATPEKCIDVISNVLVPYLLDGPFKEGDYVLQLDTTPTYTSEKVQDHLEQLGVSVISWPPKSEDLNPIRNVWEILKRRICRKRVSQSSPDKLWALIDKEWNVLRKTPDFVRGFYTSLPQRIAEVIRLNGAAV